MKALIFEKKGLENLRIEDVEKPAVGSHDVLIHVKMAGVNPIDYSTVNRIANVKPMPHIPGAEFAGTAEEVGDHVTGLKKGDRVVVYSRVFDDRCDMCLSGREMLCRNGGIVGVVTNGGYTEYAAVADRNVFKLPDEVGWEVVASLSVSALTPFHALREAGLRADESLVVFGASGNTGSFAVQFGKRFGAKVIAVSRKSWLTDFGADHIVGYGEAVDKIGEATAGRMVDVVLNSLGSETWPTAMDSLGVGGRLVFFGVLTGSKAELALDKVYNRQIRIIGSTGGTRSELQEIISISKSLKVKTWRKFRLEEGASALKSLSSSERDGRMLIEVS